MSNKLARTQVSDVLTDGAKPGTTSRNTTFGSLEEARESTTFWDTYAHLARSSDERHVDAVLDAALDILCNKFDAIPRDAGQRAYFARAAWKTIAARWRRDASQRALREDAHASGISLVEGRRKPRKTAHDFGPGEIRQIMPLLESFSVVHPTCPAIVMARVVQGMTWKEVRVKLGIPNVRAAYASAGSKPISARTGTRGDSLARDGSATFAAPTAHCVQRAAHRPGAAQQTNE